MVYLYKLIDGIIEKTLVNEDSVEEFLAHGWVDSPAGLDEAKEVVVDIPEGFDPFESDYVLTKSIAESYGIDVTLHHNKVKALVKEALENEA